VDLHHLVCAPCRAHHKKESPAHCRAFLHEEKLSDIHLKAPAKKPSAGTFCLQRFSKYMVYFNYFKFARRLPAGIIFHECFFPAPIFMYLFFVNRVMMMNNVWMSVACCKKHNVIPCGQSVFNFSTSKREKAYAYRDPAQ
jgi:hypothetical protein